MREEEVTIEKKTVAKKNYPYGQMNKSVFQILDNPESLKTYYINSFFII